MAEESTFLQRTTEVWHGNIQLEQPATLQLHLDKLSLYEGSVRGIAFLRDQAQITTWQATGKLEGDQISISLRNLRTDPAEEFDITGQRRDEAIVGVLRSSGDNTEQPVHLSPLSWTDAPPPPPTNPSPEDLPVNVYYTVSTNLGEFNLGNWSFPIIPIPTGTWSGPRLWGSTDGIVTVVLDLTSWHLNFYLTTWTLAAVGHFYVSRSEVEYEKPIKLLPGSEVYPSDRWEAVTGTLTMSRSR